MTIKVGDKVLVGGSDFERDVLYIHQAPEDSRVYYVVAYKGDIPSSHPEHQLTKVEPKTSVWFNINLGGCSLTHSSRKKADAHATGGRIGIIRIDTVNGVSTLHLEAV